MVNLSNIDEVKEMDDLSEINLLLKQGWVLLCIREADGKNIYTIGLDKWKKMNFENSLDIDHNSFKFMHEQNFSFKSR